MVMDIHEVQTVLTRLAKRRPLFHREADLQHAIAWERQLLYPDAQICLETRPVTERNLRLNIAITVRGARLAFELKYFVRTLTVTHEDELFVLRAQSAQNARRYDFMNDISRLESLVEGGVAARGFAIAMTNDSGYWSESRRLDTVDAAFRLHEARKLIGDLARSILAGKGPTKGREIPTKLRGDDLVRWLPCSRIVQLSSGEFRYLCIEVERGGHLSVAEQKGAPS